MGEEGAELLETALENWLKSISMEERQFTINLEERIHRTLQQLQYEGLTSIHDVARLRYIGRVWFDLLDLLRMGGDKRTIINNLLKLFDVGQISMDLVTEIIIILNT